MSLRKIYILKVPIALFLLFIVLVSQIPTAWDATSPTLEKHQHSSIIAGVTPGHAICLHSKTGDEAQAVTTAEKNIITLAAPLYWNLSPRAKSELFYAAHLRCDKPLNGLTSQLLI